MRVAILSESPADESALRLIVDEVLGIKTTAIVPQLESRGWHNVRKILPAISKHLHYQTEADGLVVVVDSNHTYVSRSESKNRLRDFQKLAEQCRQELKPKEGRIALKIAIGVAVPAIEGWLLFKSHQHISEASWEKGLDENKDPYSKQELKEKLYSSRYHSLQLKTQKMCEAAQVVAGDLAALEHAFPNGFGSLAKELRNWRRIT